MRVGYCVIATNVYVDFAKKLIKSIDQNGSEFTETSVFIFSDKPESFKSLRISNITLHAIKIPSYSWPDVANYRYRIFSDHKSSFVNCDFLIYTDADQYVHQIPERPIKELFLSNSIGLVEHSGYWRYYYKKSWFRFISRLGFKLGEFKGIGNLRQKIIFKLSKKIVFEKSRKDSTFSINIYFLRFGIFALRPFSTLKFFVGKIYFLLNGKRYIQQKTSLNFPNIDHSFSKKQSGSLQIPIESEVKSIKPIKITLIFKFKLFLQLFQDPISYSQWNNFGNLLTHLNWKNRGTWETRSNLMAYTPVKKRNQYFCGGVWLGEKNAFLMLCETLAQWTDLDLAAGYQAEWFDESYINAYAAYVPKFVSMPPNWNWSARYPWLSEMDKYIELLEKPDVLPIPER